MGTAVTGDLIPLLDDNGSAQYIKGRNNARDIRVGLLGALLRTGTDGVTPRPGILVRTIDASDLFVAPQATPNSTVIVRKGICVIPRTGQGAYLFVNETDLTVTMPAAPTVNPRYDIICAAAYDKGNFGADAFHGPQIEIVSGPVQASPPVPPTPAGMYKLADVFRAVNDNAISTEITDRRYTTTLTGGIRLGSSNDPTDANVGSVWGELKDDGTQIYRNNGATVTPLYEYLNRAPKVVLKRVGTHFTGTGADTVIQWDTADVNIGGMWTSGNSSVVTIQKTGMYLVQLSVFWETGNTSGARNCHITLNGTTSAQFIESDSRAANTGPEGRHPKCAQSFAFTAGDVIRGSVYQDSGASLNLAPVVLGATTGIVTRLSITYQGPST